MNLHGQIMNLATPFAGAYDEDVRDAYKCGHRDARHAAAELAHSADAEIERLRADNARIRGWLAGDAECPCCEQTAQCLEDCTFVADCPNEADRMRWIRFVLAGA
jgi:hypothetical protein